MRASFIAAHGNIEDCLEPSDDYLSAKAEELESHEPSASPLNESVVPKPLAFRPPFTLEARSELYETSKRVPFHRGQKNSETRSASRLVLLGS